MTIRSFCIAVLIGLVPFAGGAGPLRQWVPIVGYHEVVSQPAVGWATATEDFEAQLNLLSITGWSVIPLADMVDYINGKRDTLPPRAVVITVDDGWVSTRTEMFPRFQRHGFPFTLFIYPNFISVGLQALTWPDVIGMSGQGVDVESHTISHPHLNRRSQSSMSDADYAKWLHTEVADSRIAIEKRVGKPVSFLAYPYGDYDRGVENEVAADGYRAALTSQRGLNTVGTNPFELYRFVVTSDTTLEQFRKALGAGDLPLIGLSVPQEGVAPSGTQRIEARIAGYERLDPASVHIAIIGDEPFTGSYDATAGRIALETTNGFAKQREQIVVWGNDGATAQQFSAIWTFYLSQDAKDAEGRRVEALKQLSLHHTMATRKP